MNFFEFLLNIFSNREIAIIFWVIFFIVLLLINSTTRKSIIIIFASFKEKKIIYIFSSMFIYVLLSILILYIIKFWNFELLKNTIYWIFGAGVISLININDNSKQENYFSKLIIQFFKMTVIIQFIGGYFEFNLLTEMISIPIIIILVLLSLIEKNKRVQHKVNLIIEYILISYGLLVFSLSIYNIIIDYTIIDNIHNLKLILLEPILTIMYIPFLYFWALFMEYENFFSQLKFYFGDDLEEYNQIKKNVLKGCNIRLKLIRFVAKNFNYHFYKQQFGFKKQIK